MNDRLKRESAVSPLAALLKKNFSAARTVIYNIIIPIMTLSLVAGQTDIPDNSCLNGSLQISSSAEIIPFNHPQPDTSQGFRISLGLIDSVKSEVCWREIFYCEELFKTSDINSKKAYIEKDATPGFVRRWLLQYHRDHKQHIRED